MLSRIVVLLSFVSFFTDVASEMLYPVIPVYLQSIGYSALFLGLFESLAEAVTGISKAYLGSRSDVIGRRLPFVRAGYAISAVAKPMLVLFSSWWWVLAARSLERMGKGVRTGARDAMLAEASTVGTRARVFGFHRAMDTAGAVIGPSLALLFLASFPAHYRELFFLTIIPGGIAIALLFFVREAKGSVPRRKGGKGNAWSWKTQSPEMRSFMKRIGIFYLFNSADMFLLLNMKRIGGSDMQVIGAYILYNVIYAAASFPLGSIADKFGMRRVIVGGLLVFGAVYVGFSATTSITWCYVLFGTYGLYAAGTDGVAKAYVSTVCAPDARGSALGTYAAMQSVLMVAASAIAGVLWIVVGPEATLALSGLMAVVAAILLVL